MILTWFSSKKHSKTFFLKVWYINNTLIFTKIHYLPLNMQPLFFQKNKKYYGSELYFKKALSIPIHDNVSIKDAKFIIETLVSEIKKINGL